MVTGPLPLPLVDDVEPQADRTSTITIETNDIRRYPCSPLLLPGAVVVVLDMCIHFLHK